MDRRYLFAVSIALLALAGCKPAAPPACATCARAKLKNQWCEACKVGYVAGVPIKCKTLFEGLDAHGHEVVISSIKCPTCQAAIASDGFCEKCRIGWYRRQAYFSRLTYHLAKGTPRDASTIRCAVCRKNAEKYGWCEMCGVGMIGNVAVRNRADFEGGCRGYDLMMCAVAASSRCANCALCMLTDMSCFFCKIAYKDGKPVPRVAQPPAAASVAEGQKVKLVNNPG